MGDVRRATRGDEAEAAALLARAFDADPVARWFVPDARPGRLELVFAPFVRRALRTGDVWLADGAGAAVWSPPGAWKVGARDALRMAPAILRAMGPARLAARVRPAQRVQARHPRAPHLYLFAIGVVPEMQGRGVGSALLRAVLPRCDEERLGAYLEASTGSSARLYARHGFAVTPGGDAFRMAPGAPPVWLMWRDPR